MYPRKLRSMFHPTRRDVFVAVFSAAATLLWRQLDFGDEFAVIREHSFSNTFQLNLLTSGGAGAGRHGGEDALLVDLGGRPGTLAGGGGLLGSGSAAAAASRLSQYQSGSSSSGEIMPSTELVASGDGWSIWDNLYMHNGTLLVVSEQDAATFPAARTLTSTGLPAVNNADGKPNIQEREPTTDDFDIWDRRRAEIHFGSRIHTIANVSLLMNDPRQFMDHYYHFAGEMLLGTWRMYAGHLDTTMGPRGETSLPDPARAIFAHCKADEWRDKHGFNQYMLHASFPSISLETQEDWQGRVNLSRGLPGLASDVPLGESGSAKAWRFDRVVLSDRSASFRGETTGYYTHRTAASAYVSNAHVASKYWWETLRRRILAFARVPLEVMDYSVHDRRTQRALRMRPIPEPMPVLVTYVSRQGWRRRLIESNHEDLLATVRSLCEAKGWEFLEFYPERYTLDEQLAIAARSTVMFGVHGNGLTHLIAMPSTPASTVIEIFYPGGFARDYQWTAEALGHKHYGVWNDTYFTSPELPSVIYPEGFQGTQIPVYGPTVAKLIESRIEGELYASAPRPCDTKSCAFS